jgi:hypothetical protein
MDVFTLFTPFYNHQACEQNEYSIAQNRQNAETILEKKTAKVQN